MKKGPRPFNPRTPSPIMTPISWKRGKAHPRMKRGTKRQVTPYECCMRFGITQKIRTPPNLPHKQTSHKRMAWRKSKLSGNCIIVGFYLFILFKANEYKTKEAPTHIFSTICDLQRVWVFQMMNIWLTRLLKAFHFALMPLDTVPVLSSGWLQK